MKSRAGGYGRLSLRERPSFRGAKGDHRRNGQEIHQPGGVVPGRALEGDGLGENFARRRAGDVARAAGDDQRRVGGQAHSPTLVPEFVPAWSTASTGSSRATLTPVTASVTRPFAATVKAKRSDR